MSIKKKLICEECNEQQALPELTLCDKCLRSQFGRKVLSKSVAHLLSYGDYTCKKQGYYNRFVLRIGLAIMQESWRAASLGADSDDEDPLTDYPWSQDNFEQLQRHCKELMEFELLEDFTDALKSYPTRW